MGSNSLIGLGLTSSTLLLVSMVWSGVSMIIPSLFGAHWQVILS